MQVRHWSAKVAKIRPILLSSWEAEDALVDEAENEDVLSRCRELSTE